MARVALIVLMCLVGLSVATTVDSFAPAPLTAVQMEALGPNPCQMCQLIVGIAGSTITANATLEKLISVLDQGCSSLHLPAEMQKGCEAVAVAVVGIIPFIQSKIVLAGLETPIAICSFIAVCSVECCLTPSVPEQVHLSLTGDMSEMAVTWVTMNKVEAPTVWYGYDRNNLNLLVPGEYRTYTSGGWIGSIYTGVMKNLKEKTVVWYRVGDAQAGQSAIFSFKTLSSNPDDRVRFLVVGDMGADGNANATMEMMIEESKRYSFDVVLHVGDTSYANGYQRVWDQFFRNLEPVMARHAYMVMPGNHELPFNFTSYKTRFAMPSMRSESGTNLYYSVRVGGIHLLALNTESVINTPYIDETQMAWLQADLAKANAVRATSAVGGGGFIVAMGHRPFYCTNKDQEECVLWAGYLRKRLESVLLAQKVDLTITGHQHDYERFHPAFEEKLVGAATASGYVNPSAPIHILNGAAGNREGIQNDYLAAPEYSAFRASQFGYARMTVHNRTSLTWEFVANEGMKVIDRFTINKH